MTIATEQQFQAWERKIEEGVPRFEAARQVGTTLSALRRGDRVRFDDGVAVSLERQAAKAEALMAKETAKAEPSPQLVALEAKAHHPDYRDTTRVEVSGRVEHEHHGRFDIGTLAVLAAERGVIDGRPVRALAGPGEVLPDPPERAASDLPPAQLP